jgi:hydrogenase expression/formation protein HypD
MKVLVEMEDLELDGFIAPGHVSTIIGVKSYEVFPKIYKIPTVISGFEPLDVLFGIYMILRQLKQGKPSIENEYKLAVTWEGNIKAQKVMEKVFNKINGKWRGIGTIPSSKLELKKAYCDFDVYSKYDIKVKSGIDFQPGCKCNLVIIGKIKPNQCSLFMKECTPQNPIGACMVSIEGTCRIWSKNIV